MPYGVLFDLDGTLVDTTFVHTVCWCEALRQHGQDVAAAELHHAIGLPSEKLLEHCAPALDPDERAAVSEAHSTLYRQWSGRLRPHHGAVDLLRACRDEGFVVVLASSAKPADLAALRAVLDADDAITAATDAAAAGDGKPAPDPLIDAMQAGGLAPEDSVLVGDSVWDGEAAQRAGVEFVGLTCGGTPAGDLAQAGAAAIYPDPSQLLARLAQSPLGELVRRSGHARADRAGRV